MVFTDGAAKGNPGPGGWGVVVVTPDGEVTELGGGAAHTTNNRMELTGAINGLDAVRGSAGPVSVYTDSTYVMKGVTEWLRGWKAKGWKTAAKEPVKNVDLWIRLDELCAAHQIKWVWVKGHSGHDGNERADALANKGCQSIA